MEFAEILSAYGEVGILGVAAIVLIVLFATHYRKDLENSEKAHEEQTKLTNNLIATMTKQNADMTNSIVEKLTHHVINKEDLINSEQINNKIDSCLKEILNKTNASRVSLIQYHNGNNNLNGINFLKMSMTNEQVQVGVKPIISEFKDQFRSILSYYTTELTDKGNCYIDDIEEIKNKDFATYDFLATYNVQSEYGIGIEDSTKHIIGFLNIEFIDKKQVNRKNVIKTLELYKQTVQTLLCLK